MPSGSAAALAALPEHVAALLHNERRAVMSTIANQGWVHSVPVVFAVEGDEIISPIDHKPKSGVVLARVRNIERDARATLLIDHWDEQWEALLWLMIRATATVEVDPAPEALRTLNARYTQYEPDERHDALIRLRPTRLSWWSWSRDRSVHRTPVSGREMTVVDRHDDDLVDQASMDSFPASDPPPYWARDLPRPDAPRPADDTRGALPAKPEQPGSR